MKPPGSGIPAGFLTGCDGTHQSAAHDVGGLELVDADSVQSGQSSGSVNQPGTLARVRLPCVTIDHHAGTFPDACQ